MDFRADNAFFKVKLDGSDYQVLSPNVKSLTLTEELNKGIEGSLSLRDQNYVAHSKIRTGTPIEITWGYGLSFPKSIFPPAPGEIVGLPQRTIKAVVQAPNGSGQDNGDVNYSINFYEREMRSDKLSRVFSNGDYTNLVKQLFGEMGVSEMEVDFEKGSLAIDTHNPERQHGTNHNFLVELAERFRVAYRVTTIGIRKLALFTDYKKLNKSVFARKLSGAFGTKRTLSWRTDVANVMSWNWKENFGEGGQGDAVAIRVDAQGNRVFDRKVIEGGSVVVWRLEPERVKAELMKNRSLGNEIQFVQKIAETKSFEEVKRFFSRVEERTAPQGPGYEIGVKMFGDPFLTPPMQVVFDKSFPSQLYAPQLTYFIRKITHTIETKYTIDMSVEGVYSDNAFLATAALR